MIVTQPTSVSVAAGGTVAFSVALSGAGPFIYQWRLDGTNILTDIISTVAGTGTSGYFGDGGPAVNAGLKHPFGVAVDTSGNLFIADTGNNVIRKVAANGVISTVAGDGLAGYSGDNGPATNASLFNPSGVAADASGNLFIADTDNSVIRKVAANGIITTFAGNSVDDYSGDGGQATNASMYFPSGVAVDTSGNLFIADSYNNVIRKVGADGIISTVAGNGSSGYSGDGGQATNANLYFPLDVVADASGNLFVADTDNFVVRRVDARGIISTVAGNGAAGFSGDGGPATNAALRWPSSVAVDASSNLFISDTDNNVIRQVATNGIITTVAGDGIAGYAGDGAPATLAELQGVLDINGYGAEGFSLGLAADVSGNLFIADNGNDRIREVAFSSPTLLLQSVGGTNAGSYDVVVRDSSGSVTSVVATLTVIVPTAFALETPVISGKSLLLGFNLTQGSASSFTLLQSPAVTGPWTTNTTAILTTNDTTGGYQFSLTAPASTEFFQVRSP